MSPNRRPNNKNNSSQHPKFRARTCWLQILRCSVSKLAVSVVCCLLSIVCCCFAPGAWWYYWSKLAVKRGLRALASVSRPDVSPGLRDIHVCSACRWCYLSIFSWSLSGSVIWTNFTICSYRKLVVFHSEKMWKPLFAVSRCIPCMTWCLFYLWPHPFVVCIFW